MELTRNTLANLLLALREKREKTPRDILEEALAGKQSTELISRSELPLILEKIARLKPDSAGLSINDIAAIGNLLEYAMVTSTAIQNWVKRDVKELIGAPMNGKKYTIDQAAILFIVEDLKVVLDFDSIRKALTLIFNNPTDRTDDIIDPVYFYKGYADIFNNLQSKTTVSQLELESEIEKAAQHFIDKENIDHMHKMTVKNLLSLSVLSIYSSLYQSRAKKYMKKTILKTEE